MTSLGHVLATAGRDLVNLPAVDPNPFDAPESWQECQVLDVRIMATSGVVGVLFELRQSLQFDVGDTGLLICSDVRNVTWEAPDRDTSFTAWAVGSADIDELADSFRLTFDLWPSPGASLGVDCNSAMFVIGHAENVGMVPPDYGRAAPWEPLRGVATWDSTFLPAMLTHTRP